MDAHKIIIKKYFSDLMIYNKSKNNRTRERQNIMLAELFAHKQICLKFFKTCMATSLQICDVSFERKWELPRHNKRSFAKMWLMYENNQWYSSFRMKKITFLYVCSFVEDELAPSELVCLARKPLSVMEQVAIAFYKLASYCEMRVVADMFGIWTSTVQKCFHRFVKAINRQGNEFIFLPALSEAKSISRVFESISNIPQIIGCIDGCHVPILPPKVGYRDFVNRKGWASYVLQAVVDCNYKFRDISCKYPGSAHDAAVFYDSGLFKNWDTALPKKQVEVEGIQIPHFIIGDPAYPLLPCLLKNYLAPKTQKKSRSTPI